MSKLLCTLGTSWAVVPEAFLLGNEPEQLNYEHVYVITTSSDLTRMAVHKVEDWFAQYAPQTTLRVLAIEYLADITNAQDHQTFEEAFLQVYFAILAETLDIHVCLAGGFKTMSATAQEVAGLLGCKNLFHIIAPFGLKTENDAEIRAAIAEEKIRKIPLGNRNGWPTIRELAAEAPLLPPRDEPFLVEDFSLSNAVQHRVEAASRLAASEPELANLPFPQLARWSPSERAALHSPLNPDPSGADHAWLLALPKIELHCHLGGFATHGEPLLQVRNAAENIETLPSLPEQLPPPAWPIPQERFPLEAYMQLGDANGSKLLKDPGCLRKQIELLYSHLCEQNIAYAEVRCSPNNYTSSCRSAWTVLSEIRETFQCCMDASVAAAVSDADSVPACFQNADAMPTEPNTRQFIPYEQDKNYHQTWRDLPHRHQAGTTAFVTFRLADSLPAEKLHTWYEEKSSFLATNPKPWDETTWKNYNRQFPQRLEAWLDQPHGECLLQDPTIAACVESALSYFDGQRYILDAFVIMPNHVHVLVKPLHGFTLDKILHSWKSYTATIINRQLNRTGQLWTHESFDHLIRSSKQLDRLRKYIHSNPEKAGLTQGFLIGQGVGLISWQQQPSSPVRTPTPTSKMLDPTTQPSQRLAATCHVNLIIIATRKQGGDRSDISRHLALAITAAQHWQDGCRVVGVDLAGFENKDTRAALFATDFEPVHRVGLAVTVHAGENDDAEGIWQAVFKLNARRLGHALHLIDAPDLLRAVAERRIGVEMCPYANYQIKGYRPMPDNVNDYPLLHYLHAGIPVTVNTDNIGISAASLTDNFLLLAHLCPAITRLDVLRLIRNAMDQAFLSSSHRNHLLAIPIPHPR